MRVWAIALFLSSVLGLFTGAHAIPRAFAPHRLLETRFYDGHYETYFHRTQEGRDVLMALDRKRLNLIKFDIGAGQIVSEERLLSGGRAPTLIHTLSSSSGEFWVACARATRDGQVIELHSDSRQEYFSIEDQSPPLSLELVEAGEQIYLVAAYPQSVVVFSRRGGQLEQVAQAPSTVLIRKAQALVTSKNHLRIITLASDGKIRRLDLDAESETLRQRWARAVNASFIATILGDGDETLVAVVRSGERGDHVQFLREKSRHLSKAQPVDMNIGRVQWVQSENGELYLAAMNAAENQTRIQLLNTRGEQRSVGAGDARRISDVAALTIGQNEYLVFLKDQRHVYIQGDDATSVIRPAPRARSVRLSSMHRLDGGEREVIAVMTDFERSTHVQLITFARSRESQQAAKEITPKN